MDRQQLSSVIAVVLSLCTFAEVSCQCTAKYTCENAAPCREGVCQCRAGYTGTRCETRVPMHRMLTSSRSNDITAGDYGNGNHNGTNGSYNNGHGNVGTGIGNGNGNSGDNNGNTDISMSTFYCDCSSACGKGAQGIGRTGCANDLQCYNQGTCNNFNDGSGNSYCSCPNGFSGTQCQVPIKATPGSVRLIAGRKPWNGRVEIYEGGAWRTLCNTGWSQNNAEVVCRQLGFRGVEDSYQQFGQGGSGQAAWARIAQCFGGELRLADCPFTMAKGTCGHPTDVGVDCRPF